MHCTLTVPLVADTATEQPTPQTHPIWCATDLEGTDPGTVLHVSAPTEVAGVVVTLEQFDALPGAGTPDINVTALDRRLTASEARTLAAVLTFYAAMTEGRSHD